MSGELDSPKMLPVSEQMKAWSSALAGEVADWPELEVRSFFGFSALYRRAYMFAALPRTRSWGTGNCFAFKVESLTPRLRARAEKDSRVNAMQIKNVRWFSFEIASDADLHDALDWLGRAYDVAGKARNRK